MRRQNKMHVLSLRNTPTHCQRSLMFHIIFTLAEQLFRFCRLEKISVVKSIKIMCVGKKERDWCSVSKREYSVNLGAGIMLTNTREYLYIYLCMGMLTRHEEKKHSMEIFAFNSNTGTISFVL